MNLSGKGGGLLSAEPNSPPCMHLQPIILSKVIDKNFLSKVYIYFLYLFINFAKNELHFKGGKLYSAKSSSKYSSRNSYVQNSVLQFEGNCMKNLVYLFRIWILFEYLKSEFFWKIVILIAKCNFNCFYSHYLIRFIS